MGQAAHESKAGCGVATQIQQDEANNRFNSPETPPVLLALDDHFGQQQACPTISHTARPTCVKHAGSPETPYFWLWMIILASMGSTGNSAILRPAGCIGCYCGVVLVCCDCCVGTLGLECQCNHQEHPLKILSFSHLSAVVGFAGAGPADACQTVNRCYLAHPAWSARPCRSARPARTAAPAHGTLFLQVLRKYIGGQRSGNTWAPCGPIHELTITPPLPVGGASKQSKVDEVVDIRQPVDNMQLMTQQPNI